MCLLRSKNSLYHKVKYVHWIVTRKVKFLKKKRHRMCFSRNVTRHWSHTKELTFKNTKYQVHSNNFSRKIKNRRVHLNFSVCSEQKPSSLVSINFDSRKNNLSVYDVRSMSIKINGSQTRAGLYILKFVCGGKLARITSFCKIINSSSPSVFVRCFLCLPE